MVHITALAECLNYFDLGAVFQTHFVGHGRAQPIPKGWNAVSQVNPTHAVEMRIMYLRGPDLDLSGLRQPSPEMDVRAGPQPARFAQFAPTRGRVDAWESTMSTGLKRRSRGHLQKLHGMMVT